MTARIAIIGGGISGLTAAHRLAAERKLNNLPIEISLFESQARLGGVIKSDIFDDYVVEHGPDSFSCEKPWAADLCKELNLFDHLQPTNKMMRRAYVVRGRQPSPLPEGFMLTAPTKILPFITSRLLSFPGALRTLCDLLLPCGNHLNQEESVAQFITRRFGKEMLDRVGQPIVGGIYTGDVKQLSAQATMGKFVECERKYGSVIRGLWRTKEQSVDSAGGARYSLFFTPKMGMQEIVTALESSLPAESIFLNSDIQSITQETNGSWLIKEAQGTSFAAEAVILALPAQQLSLIVRELNAKLSRAFADIECASSLVINFLFRACDIGFLPKGFGFVVPAFEGANILAGSMISTKFSKRAPQGMIVIRVFMGGALSPDLIDKDDRQLVQLALQDLGVYLKLTGRPVNVQIARWPNSMPQYKVGHSTIIAQIENQVKEFRGLALAGNCYHGVGIADCVLSGENAAKSVLAYIKECRILSDNLTLVN